MTYIPEFGSAVVDTARIARDLCWKLEAAKTEGVRFAEILEHGEEFGKFRVFWLMQQRPRGK